MLPFPPPAGTLLSGKILATEISRVSMADEGIFFPPRKDLEGLIKVTRRKRPTLGGCTGCCIAASGALSRRSSKGIVLRSGQIDGSLGIAMLHAGCPGSIFVPPLATIGVLNMRENNEVPLLFSLGDAVAICLPFTPFVFLPTGSRSSWERLQVVLGSTNLVPGVWGSCLTCALSLSLFGSTVLGSLAGGAGK